MIISGLTAANISTTVWAQATRSLTNLGAATISTFSNQSLAITTQFTFNPAAGHFRQVSIGVSQPAGGAGNTTIEYFDGTNIAILATAAPGATAFIGCFICGAAAYVRINNSNNTNAAKWWASYVDYTV